MSGESNSKHFFREKGARAEKIVYELSQKSFFKDWCYPNPIRPDGKELCDLLVVFDETAIIWQIKDLKVDAQGRYRKAEVDKNIRQLSGARRTLFDLKERMTLTNPRRGKEQFDPSLIKSVHLISVLMGDGTGPLPFMDSVKNYQVHVFTREFTEIALTELDTISDFCQYLKAKEQLSDKEIIILGGEENLLGSYLHAGRTFDHLNRANSIFLDDTIWAKIQSKPEFIAKKKLDKVSYGWDSIIDRAHEGSHKYERLARELARPDRFTRRMLSKSFLQVYSELRASNHQMMRRYMPVYETSYCFLVTNDDEYPSPKRARMLQYMCFVARGLPPFNNRIIGISTGWDNRSYDFVFLQKPTWTEEDERTMKKLQKDLGIFVGPRITAESEDEYPQVETIKEDSQD